jgi:dTDP-4-amino-4,6-dideoxygalactose transaminase
VIPVASPLAAYRRLKPEIDAAIARVMDSGTYILGPEVRAFEAEFAQAVGVPAATAVASGTEALWLALRAANIGPGDEVIVPALSASATVAAVVECGARPVFADVRPSDLTVDTSSVAQQVGRRTKAIVAVHLYGNPAELGELTTLCEPAGLVLI